MTYNEIINEFKVMATTEGIEARDESNECTLQIEYYFNGSNVGSAAYISCAEHPEYMTRSDLNYAKEQIKYIATKCRANRRNAAK